MSIDLTKLSPAPWEAILCGKAEAPDTLKRIVQSVDPDGSHIAFVFEDSPDNAAFIALARNAFDVMMRRGWTVTKHMQHDADHGKWRVLDEWDRSVSPMPPSIDPFAALVEADAWYGKNVETDAAGSTR